MQDPWVGCNEVNHPKGIRISEDLKRLSVGFNWEIFSSIKSSSYLSLKTCSSSLQWKLSWNVTIAFKEDEVWQNARYFKDFLVWKWNENRKWDRDSSKLSLNGHARDSLVAQLDEAIESDLKVSKKWWT